MLGCGFIDLCPQRQHADQTAQLTMTCKNTEQPKEAEQLQLYAENQIEEIQQKRKM